MANDMTDELDKQIEALEPPLMPEFISWWNSTHDFDFVKDSGLYEKHALRCWMAGRNAATALERAGNPEGEEMSTFGDDLIQAMTEALAHAKGDGPAIVHEPVALRAVIDQIESAIAKAEEAGK